MQHFLDHPRVVIVEIYCLRRGFLAPVRKAQLTVRIHTLKAPSRAVKKNFDWGQTIQRWTLKLFDLQLIVRSENRPLSKILGTACQPAENSAS
jgi:hypothetical protein